MSVQFPSFYGRSTTGTSSIYDTETPIGNKITNMPFNLTAWQNLAPYNYSLSLPGVGETQYCVMDMSVSPFMAQLAKNPWALLNIWNSDSFLSQAPGYISPQQTNEVMQSAKTQGRAAFINSYNSSVVNSIGQTVEGIEKSLENILKDDSLTADQKTRLNAELEKIKAIKEKLTQLKENMGSMDPEEVQKQVTELNKELQTAGGEMQKTVQEIQEELAKEGKTLDGKNGTDGTDGKEGAQGADSNTSEGKEAASEDGEAPATRKVSDKQKKTENFVMNKICDLIDNAIDGLGTNYDDDDKGLKNVIEQNINKDNVLELFEAWDKGYAKKGSYADDEDGLIESLMDDCEGDQKQEIAGMLIEALAERALADGIDVDKEVAAARRSIKSNWIGWRDDDKIQNAVNKLKNKVASGEKGIRSKAAQKDEAAKAKAQRAKDAEAKKAQRSKTDAARKQQEKIYQETVTFIKDMRECTDNKKIKSLPSGVQVVKDASGNFKGFSIRIKGKEYFGKDYLALAAALEKDGLVLPTK